MGKCYTSEYIFSEVMTLFRAKKFPETEIEKVGNALLHDSFVIVNEPNFRTNKCSFTIQLRRYKCSKINRLSYTLLHLDFEQFQETWEFFKKYNGFSFTDCSTVVISQAFGIKAVASFDSDFDKGIGVKRIF